MIDELFLETACAQDKKHCLVAKFESAESALRKAGKKHKARICASEDFS